MRRSARLAAAALVVALSAPAGAQEEWEPTPAGWRSGPIEHVATVPVEAGTAVGGTLHDGRLYVTTWRSFSIYDVSDPVAPRLLSITPLPVQIINEGPVTNGEILLLNDDFRSVVQVWDVRDPAAPTQLAVLDTPRPDHIWACVRDCEYAYGSGGSIIDLRDPANPSVAGDWREGLEVRGVHSIGAVGRDHVLTGSLPQYLLDIEEDPANPTVVATAEPPTTAANAPFIVIGPAPESLPGHVGWPRDGRGGIALTTLETPFSGSCNERSGGLVAYDAGDWEETGTFEVADVHRITENGLPSEGRAATNAVGCSPLGFDPHPDWKETRLLPVAWFEAGVRLLTVTRQGEITERGGFIPHGTEAFMVLWRDAETLYSIDTSRGIDVFRVDASAL